MSKLAKQIFNVRFAKAKYDTKKEMNKHKKEMLADGWNIEYERKLAIDYKKTEIETLEESV